MLLTLSSAASCSSGDTGVIYEPYTGPPAYPNRRVPLPRPAGYFAFVSNNGSDTVSVVDLPKNEVVASVNVGRDPVGIDGPHHLAVDRNGFVFVALSYPAPSSLPGPHAAHASSVRPGYVIKLAPDDLHVVGEVQIEPNPGEIVLSGDGTKLVVSHFDLARAADTKLSDLEQRATLAIIDPASVSMDGSPPPKLVKVCRAPHGLSIAADGKRAFVACYGDDALGIVDLDSGEITLVPAGGKGPYSAVLSNTGRLVAIGNTESKETRFFDAESRAMTATAVVSQGAPFFAGWSADDALLFIPTQSPDALVVANAATGRAMRQRVFDATCVKPHEAVLGRDGAFVYLVCEGDHRSPGTVLALDPSTLETRATLSVGVYPDRLAFSRP